MPAQEQQMRATPLVNLAFRTIALVMGIADLPVQARGARLAGHRLPSPDYA
jgi:hypothetical protein